MKSSVRAIVVTLFILVLFCGWYAIAADYDYGALSGTYVYGDGQESSTLLLKSDRTFEQDLKRNGTLTHATGTWRRVGEGGVAFSKEFLRLSGQQSYSDRFGHDANSATNGDFGGRFYKILTVYPELELDAVPMDIRLHRRLFQ